MALDKTALTAALKAGFEAGMGDENWTLQQAAGAMATAIDAYVRTAEVINVTADVVDGGGNLIGTAAQTGTGGLT